MFPTGETIGEALNGGERGLTGGRLGGKDWKRGAEELMLESKKFRELLVAGGALLGGRDEKEAKSAKSSCLEEKLRFS